MPIAPGDGEVWLPPATMCLFPQPGRRTDQQVGMGTAEAVRVDMPRDSGACVAPTLLTCTGKLSVDMGFL